MKLTKKEALEKTREMWLWLADETEKQKRKVQKYEYFVQLDLEMPENESYSCEFDKEQHREQHLRKNDDCSNCPMTNCKYRLHSCFEKWYKAYDYQEAAEFCKEIAQLATDELKRMERNIMKITFFEQAKFDHEEERTLTGGEKETRSYYSADGLGENGKGYTVFFEVTNPEAEEVEDCCNWNQASYLQDLDLEDYAGKEPDRRNGTVTIEWSKVTKIDDKIFVDQ